jgi:hypothetical protein
MAANSSAGTNSTFIVCGWWLVGWWVGGQERNERATGKEHMLGEAFPGTIWQFYVFFRFCCLLFLLGAGQSSTARGLIADLLP